MKSLSFLVFFLLTFHFIKGQAPENVNLPTGQIDLNIPLYNYTNNAQRLSLNLFLNYNTPGIKIDEIASEVGLGWTLNAGGRITRHMVGGLDDKYPEGTMYQSGINTSDYDAFIPIGSSPTVNNFYKDNELDVYEFNFNGRRGSFCIGRDGSVLQHLDSKMKITFTEEDMTSQYIVTRISGFTITTEDGIQYTFDQKELTHQYYNVRGTYQDDATLPTGEPYLIRFPLPTEQLITQNFVSAWYLSSIKNTLTGKEIQFQYVTNQFNMKISYDQSNADIDNENNGHSYSDTYVTSNITRPRLTKILFPGNINIEFNYEDNPRLDYGTDPNDNALSTIQVKKGNEFIKGFQLSYKYTYKNDEYSYTEASSLSDPNPVDDDVPQNYLRLILKELKVTGPGMEAPPYEFFYKLWYGQDGPHTADDIVPPRLTADKNGFGYYQDPLYSQNGLLEKIQYPTGGYTAFFYMTNDLDHPSSGLEHNGNSVIKTVTYDGVDHANDIITTFNYVLHDKKGNVLLSPDGYPISSLYGREQSVTTQAKSILCESNGSPEISNIILVLGSSIGVPKILLSVINSIISFFIGPTFETINYTIIKACGVFNGNRFPDRYSEVEVIYGDGSDNLGKTIYSFTSFNDVPPLFPTQSPPFSQKQRAADWCYGLPKSIKVFNKQNQLIKETDYKYNFIYRVNETSYYLSEKIEPYGVISVKISHFDEYRSHIDLETDSYYPITGRAELISASEKSYSPDGNYLEKVMSYEYDPETFQLKKQSTYNSRGNAIEKRIYYPNDYSLTGVIQDMKDHNLIAVPVSTETWEHSGAEEPQLLNAVINDYQVISNGDIKPLNQYILQSSTPISQSTIGSFDPDRLNRNTDYFKRETAFAYGGDGNVVETYSNGKTTSRIYDYNGRKLVAIVKNAAPDEIAYTSFEADGKGNWQFSGTPITINSSGPFAITGIKYYNLNSGALRKPIAGLSNGKLYRISYWSRNDNTFNLNYANTSYRGETINGWTYFEHIFTAGGSDVVLSGDGLIDEVRLYPAETSMESYTYAYLKGKTSYCGAGNRIIYYEYDELGRLIDEKDQDGNIIKAYKYQYKQ